MAALQMFRNSATTAVRDNVNVIVTVHIRITNQSIQEKQRKVHVYIQLEYSLPYLDAATTSLLQQAGRLPSNTLPLESIPIPLLLQRSSCTKVFYLNLKSIEN